MSAEYTMQEMNNLHQDGETLLYPRMIIRDCCGTEELASTISEESSFTPGEVMGMMRQLCRKMAAAMAEGRSVKLDGLGTFSPSLALRKGRERETTDGSGKRRNAGSIEVGSVNFRADRMMVQEINHRCHLERSPRKFVRHVSKFTPEERLAKAQQFLEEHPMMTVSDYTRMTGLSRTMAGQELRKWYTTPGSGIDIAGSGSHRVYIKRKENI